MFPFECLDWFCISSKIRLCPNESIFFKTIFPPSSKKKPRPHDAFLNTFYSSSRKRNSEWKRYHLWWEHAHLLVFNTVTRSFSKTYVFIHPQQYSKTAFSKTSSSKSVVEKMRWVTIFTGYVWTVGQTGRGMIKSCFSQCGEVTLVLSLCFTGSSYAPHMLASSKLRKNKSFVYRWS